MEEFNPTLSGGEQGDEDLQKQEPAERKPEVEGGQQGEEPGAGDAGRQKEKQSHEFNAAMAAARRKAEAETSARLAKQFDSELAALKIPNPAKPGSFFGSKAELEEYSGALRRASAEERAKKEGRDVSEIMEEDENRDFLRKMRQEKELSKKEQETKRKQEEFIAKDLAEFGEKYPDADVEQILANKAFVKFCGTRMGREPLAGLWSDFHEIAGEAAKSATAKRETKAERGTYAGNGAEGGVLTAAQRAELKAWNESYPEMAMTEKQFLER